MLFRMNDWFILLRMLTYLAVLTVPSSEIKEKKIEEPHQTSLPRLQSHFLHQSANKIRL